MSVGLETIFHLTWGAKYELRVDMEDFENGNAYAQYSSFSIDSEEDSYRLRLSGYVDGGAGEFGILNMTKRVSSTTVFLKPILYFA